MFKEDDRCRTEVINDRIWWKQRLEATRRPQTVPLRRSNKNSVVDIKQLCVNDFTDFVDYSL